jgi:hypothetical protein
VGVFWAFLENQTADQVVVENLPVLSGKAYVDCLTFEDGHAEAWELWRRLTPRDRAERRIPEAVVYLEYDQVPRGRVVYHQPSRTFWLYIDERVRAPSPPGALRDAFGLADC